ncbi:GntR family transcriptional regulator [Nitratireductor indicus]|uniref:GntR family transcriptional regulator n=1 Tax=Nitratireductor indicus TaxID=721133 RepID=UPI00287502F1|nr:GntR family transcriptional regulator [Nitratireductor indicus]MDS1138769.1 GntR family transcriptional regulator [Nitratireductor indicus]
MTMSFAGAELSTNRGDRLAEVLRTRILEGVYPPGSWLREADLREEFGFSNGPVRDAFQGLVADGLAERIPSKGVRVIELDKRQLLDLFRLRLALLQYAAERAARHASQEALTQGLDMLRDLNDQLDAARTESGQQRFTGELSRWLLEAAECPMVSEVYGNAVIRTQIYLNAMLHKTGGARLKPHIETLVHRVVERDAEGARKAVQDLTIQTLRDMDIEPDI